MTRDSTVPCAPLSPDRLDFQARALFREQRALKRLDGWFLTQEIRMRHYRRLARLAPPLREAALLERVAAELPLSISDHAVFAGTQNDAFARSYALINPDFRVDAFKGYCDPLAVFNDIRPDASFTAGRIRKVRRFVAASPYVKALQAVHRVARRDTREVAYFVEQVTGHIIPDFGPVLRDGIEATIRTISRKARTARPPEAAFHQGMARALGCAVTLAGRYAALARTRARRRKGVRKEELLGMARTLDRVPRFGARTLFEAVQSFIILWQVMCLEQSPNPFAFSAGNVDRLFELFRAREGLDRASAAGLFKHLLAFFNVGDRSWAISQNLLLGGKSASGEDLSNPCTFAFLDAFYGCNFPQPILSVRLHRNTPDSIYGELGRFFFTPGRLTPSLFNDDAVFPLLKGRGVARRDIQNYAVAGCQEPLIQGKENGNTTNSWLNLPKILEITLNRGRCALTGARIGLSPRKMGFAARDPLSLLKMIRPLFYAQLEHFLERMTRSANGCTAALSLLPVPFASAVMGGMDTGCDMRDIRRAGTPYHGSGCLVHGLSVVADSFVAIDDLVRTRPEHAGRLLRALRNDFKGEEGLRQFLLTCGKYGNHSEEADREAARVCGRVSDRVAAQKTALGAPFRPDWSSPSTHLLYGYWVGATPDGRKARQMLGYGVDPLYGMAGRGLYSRIRSLKRLPFAKMTGGYASHLGLNPKCFPESRPNDKGLALKRKVIAPLFSGNGRSINPYYVYFNVTTPETLRKVLAEPEKYAPDGIYIMRIHGTFVNFLDLSPDIQQDIILRLDLPSTLLS